MPTWNCCGTSSPAASASPGCERGLRAGSRSPLRFLLRDYSVTTVDPRPERRITAARRLRRHRRGFGQSASHRRRAVAPWTLRRIRFPTHVARAIRSLAFVVLCLASLELAARLFWRSHGVPFAHPERVLQAYYPGLAKIDQRNPKWVAARAHVLLLGGSTLHPRWGTVQEELREQLAFAGYRDVRLFNLAGPGLTSRDSRLVYEAIGHEHFDLVLVYDGINEARANNVPPDLFRDDYGHYGWYEIVNALSRHQGRARLALPYTLEYLGLRVRQLVLASHYVSRN